MKIQEIRTYALKGRTHSEGWDNTLDPVVNLHTLVEVVSEEGILGYGSVYSSKGLVDASLEVLAPYVLGQNALEPERISETLHQTTFWHGHGGAITHTISGIDIALWDILGKATGQPIGRLLGGCYRTKIKPYGSILFDEPGRLMDKLYSLVEKGFKAFKLGWGDFGRRNRDYDEELVSSARDAVGPEIDLMVDAGGSEQFWPHSYKWALETSLMLSDYDILWFEEPLKPDDVTNFRMLREHSPLPIASGEVLTRRQNFLPWIEQHAVDIIQPDLTKVGGISEGRKIAWLAYDHGVQLIPHGWNTAIGLAADLHLSAAMPLARFVEFITPSPYLTELVETPFVLDEEGYLTIPDGPGLGISINLDYVKRISGRE